MARKKAAEAQAPEDLKETVAAALRTKAREGFKKDKGASQALRKVALRISAADVLAAERKADGSVVGVTKLGQKVRVTESKRGTAVEILTGPGMPAEEEEAPAVPTPAEEPEELPALEPEEEEGEDAGEGDELPSIEEEAPPAPEAKPKRRSRSKAKSAK
jgi:hypothetical protein